jgi:hypothetical protein
MYLLYLCKIQVNGRTPSTTACLRRLKLFPSQMYYPCTFCTCVKYKSTAVHHRRRSAFAVLIIPFSDVLPMYLLYLCKIQVSGFHRWCPRSHPSYGSLVDGVRPLTCILHKYKRYMGSTSEKGILKTAKAGRRRWCTAVDLYFSCMLVICYLFCVCVCR